MFVCKNHSKQEMRWLFNISLCTSKGLCEVCATEGPCVDLPGHLITTEPPRRTLGEEADAAGMSVEEYLHAKFMAKNYELGIEEAPRKR